MWSNCFLQYPKEEEKLIYENGFEAKKENANVDHEFSEKLFYTNFVMVFTYSTSVIC